MSLNPVQFGSDVVEQFGRYLRTTFPLADQDLARQFAEGLGMGPGARETLAQGPYVHLSRPFVLGPRLADMAAEPDLGMHPALPGIFSRFETIYRHQERAYRAANAGRHLVVSTGTGSGKTEAFLLPVLDYCLHLRDRGDEDGVAAVLIYPMNALVNDQLERLRPLLAGTRITFGRYTGETPEDAVPHRQLDEPRPYTRHELERHRSRLEELPLPWEECHSRALIRRRKPRLLLTNYAQLEQLLLRDRDLDLLRSTPLRFFVLDELHTYTGSLGAEVACLVRRLRTVAGKQPGEVVCIGSSATVVDRELGERSPFVVQDFAAKLFGVGSDTVELVTEQYQERRPVRDSYAPPPPAQPAGLLDEILRAVRDTLLADDVEDVPDEVARLAERLCGRAGEGRTAMERLYALLAGNRLVGVLQDSFARPDELDAVLPRLRSMPGREGASDGDLKAEILAYLTLGALARRDDEPLLRPKFHYFIKGLGGLWLGWEGNSPRPAPLLHFREEESEWRRYPLLVCRSCGQHYVRVAASDPLAQDDGRSVAGVQTIRTLASLADRPQDGETEYYLADRIIGQDDESEQAESRAYVCRRCGAIHDAPGAACRAHGCGAPGELVPIHAFPGLDSCRSCGARNQEGSPLVTYMGSQEVYDVMILAQTMLSVMPESDLRKLLIFADSRQDAAFQAGWMESRSFRFRVRHLAYQILDQHRDHAFTFNDLVDRIDDLAVETGFIPAHGEQHDEHMVKIRWMLLEEFSAATERQRRNSLEQIGLARIDYDGVRPEHMGAFAEQWATRLDAVPAALSDIVCTILDYLRLRHAVSDPLLGRAWTDRDREVRRGQVSVFEHYYPKVVLRQTTRDERLKAYVVGFRSSRWMSGVERILTRALPLVDRAVLGEFLDELWAWLLRTGVLVEVQLTCRRGAQLQPVPGLGTGWQVNLDMVRVSWVESRFVCNQCRTARARALPTGQCPAYQCDGAMRLEPRDADHYDVVQYTRFEFVPLNAREHSAQVPKADRQTIERLFKQRGVGVNCLVATPTLELGVDIGQLEMVLMRNAPPSPANYAQRAGRAGRRHRIGVVFTYCRQVQHDQYFYADPPLMISGEVRLPAFSLRNAPLIQKHVHSTLLTALRSMGSEDVNNVLARVFPQYIWAYFGAKEEERMRYLPPGRPDYSDLRQVLREHEGDLLGVLEGTFTTQWPVEDQDAVDRATLKALLRGMPDELERVVGLLLAEINQYLGIIAGFTQRTQRREVLTPEEERRKRNYEYSLRRRWEENLDNYSLGYLARQGLFPGYALVKESVRAQCARPTLDVSRYPSAALRELTPANRIYANREQFKVRSLELYRMSTGQTRRDSQAQVEELLYDPGHNRVTLPHGPSLEGGQHSPVEFRAVRLIDVELEGLGRISDQQEYRFRVGFNEFALLLREHHGGHQGHVGVVPYQWLQGARLRLVNLGTRQKGLASPQRDSHIPSIGFPICPVCGETRSPFASPTEITHFMEFHERTCNRRPDWYSLFADIFSDVLCVGPFSEDDYATNAMEAVRLGARQVLDMGDQELESTLLTDGDGRKVMALYDPTPGGTGFLPLFMTHWESIVLRARQALSACTCQKACYSCLLNYRNQQHHGVLDRHRALNSLEECYGSYSMAHEVPAVYGERTTDDGYNDSPFEDTFLRILGERNFPMPEQQYVVDLGNGQTTLVDFAYPDQRVLIYIDGLSTRIHGNPDQQRQDRIIRVRARALGWSVLEIGAQDLGDETMLEAHMQLLAMELGRL
jgi:hypothetical protein